jgi:threonine dehydrogenase-like Zn-dependent dehydrogenase
MASSWGTALWRETGCNGTRPEVTQQLLPAVLDGTVNPGNIFDRSVGLDDTPAGYVAMDERSALKVLVRPDGRCRRLPTHLGGLHPGGARRGVRAP